MVGMVYPNPSNGNLTLSQKHLISSITVYNTKGSFVYEAEGLLRNINLHHLPKGNYLLNIETENAVYVQKIIIF